ncbi:Uncharacterized protein OBRU01_24563 [Operophtera brumata]|uniref:Uncharacterized protein n=1 Tax=Operophtera brumata TaxID=104452 RepID=A0A0L7KLB5_OPEBR|nr:Uncharacterized protein OBRU01_24563 [Operophtera brumata]
MEEERKAERKRKRFAARLKSSKGIVCIETAGPNIVVCNAGQATGFEKDSVTNLINEYSLDMQSPKFIAEKGESHAFLVFRNTENAVSFFNACHGKAKADKNGTLMYLNYDDEKLFIELFDWTSEDSSNLKNRQVKHYGYEFRYGTNDVELNNPLSEKIPLECDVLWKRLEEQGFTLGRPDQLTVNKYSPGNGMNDFYENLVAVVNGGCDPTIDLCFDVIVMDWRHRSGKNVPVMVPARSMLMMQGEASTTDPVVEYRTGGDGQTLKIITADTRQRQTRISLTFSAAGTVQTELEDSVASHLEELHVHQRSGPCECGFKALCDSAGGTVQTELEDSVASHLEELHVHQRSGPCECGFKALCDSAGGTVQMELEDSVASHLEELHVHQCAAHSRGVSAADRVRLDVLRAPLRDACADIAGERSSGLLSECAAHSRGVPAADRVRLDVLRAPLRDACADVVICIAVIHHMSTKSRSNYLSKNKVATENAQVNVNGVNLHIHENRTQFQHKDLLVPWKLNAKTDKLTKCDKKLPKSDTKVSDSDNRVSRSDKNVSSDELVADNTLLRFYHVFEEGELDELCREVGFQIESNFYEEGNWCVICKKL